MRANLDRDGHLIPPRSFAEARRRLQQIDHHLPKLVDRGLDKNAALLRSERDQLARWLGAAPDPDDHEAFWSRP